MDQNDDEQLTPAQVAAALGVSEKTLANWRSANTGPPRVPALTPRGPVRYRRSELEAWRASNRWDSLETEDADELLTIGRAANLLGVREQTLLNWRSEGQGPRSLRTGRRVAYRRSDVEAWMREKGRRVPAAENPPPQAAPGEAPPGPPAAPSS